MVCVAGVTKKAQRVGNVMSQAYADIQYHPVVLTGYSMILVILVIVMITATLRQHRIPPSITDTQTASPESQGTSREQRGCHRLLSKPIQSTVSRPSSSFKAQVAFTVICAFVVLSLSAALRSATLRLRRVEPLVAQGTVRGSDPVLMGALHGRKRPESDVVYNHRETDEVIFAVRGHTHCALSARDESSIKEFLRRHS